MEFDAEFFVLLGFLVFVGVLIYVGAHRTILKGLDARGEAIQAELDQADGCATKRPRCSRASKRRPPKRRPAPRRSSPKRAPRPSSSPRTRPSA